MHHIKQIITVTHWEFSRFFKPKKELIGLLFMVVISAVFYLVSVYAMKEKKPEIEVYINNDTDGKLTDKLKDGFVVRHLPTERKELFIRQLNVQKNKVLLDIRENGIGLYAYKSNRDIKKLKREINDYHRNIELQKLGISDQQLAAVLSAASIEESFIFKDNSKKRVILACVFAGLMLMAVFISFAYQFTAITGEKQLKITEQIVSAITPQTWMDGKILGITLTSMSSMVTYSLLGIIGCILYFQFTGLPVSGIVAYFYLPSIALYFPFALLGVLIWNSLLAAIASIITDPNNSGKSSLMLLPMIFVLASFLVIRDPDSGLSVFLSWFPLTSASAMPMRWAITEVGIWQLTGSFLLLALTFYFLRRTAGKIFRVSILMTGKEPGWSELYRLLSGNP